MRSQRNPPAVHWCTVCDEYLNLPVDRDEQGRRMGECPYCGEMIWEDANEPLGLKGGESSGKTDDPVTTGGAKGADSTDNMDGAPD